MNEGKILESNKIEEVKQPMDELKMDLSAYEELDPIESPACIIGRFFVVST